MMKTAAMNMLEQSGAQIGTAAALREIQALQLVAGKERDRATVGRLEE
jgi:hypothetical protein